MSETIAPVIVRRVQRPDLDNLGAWLIKRLQERHTEATPAQIMGWLRGCLASNEFLFLRTARACALAQFVRQPLEPQPEAWEIFCFVMAEGDEHEADVIYPRMASWASNLNASKLWIGIWSDIPAKRAAGKIGRQHHTKCQQHVLLGRVV